MASVILAPLALQLAMKFGPFIVNEVISLIHHQHSTVTPSPENNPKKLAAVVSDTIPLIQGLVDRGTIPALPANGAELAGLVTDFVQGVFNGQKSAGLLPPRPGDPLPPAPPIPAVTSLLSSFFGNGISVPYNISGKLTIGGS